MQDDPKLFDENVDEKVKAFVSAATNQVQKLKQDVEEIRWRVIHFSFHEMIVELVY